MKFERLSLFNYRKLRKLSLKSREFNSINTNVYELLDALNLKEKILIKRNIYLLKDANEYYGYLWIQHLYNNIYLINDLYLMSSRLDFFDDLCKGKILLYDTLINSDCNKSLPSYNFKVSDISDILKLQLNLSVDTDNNDYIFETFIKDKHEEIRCELQNNIFDDHSRIPITKDDIYFDEEQDYYIDEGFLFMKENEEYIGMGQIINLKGKLTIVNFGIRKDYRHNGYAHILLKKLIQKGKDLAVYLNKSTLYIRVSRKNEAAYNIYKNAGFQYDDSIITWER